MRKLFLLLSLFLLVACSKSTSHPAIFLSSVRVNDEPTDYARSMSDMPALELSDEVTVDLWLDGDGGELNTFLVQEAKEDGTLSLLDIDFDDLPENDLSQDKEFTDKDKGVLGFTDGVKRASLKVKAKVQRLSAEEAKLNLYLFCKEVESEGAKLELTFKLNR